MARVHNFCAGPAALPLAVLERARDEMLDWQGNGMSSMEMSHRSKEIVAMAANAELNLRKLMNISDDYAVLFLQGGATGQFSAIPLNLAAGGKADYLNTGQWSKKAISEAKKYLNVNVVASSEAQNFTTIPDVSDWKCDPQASYLHYTPNETIGGVEFHSTPDIGNVPLVADMSSTILSRPVDVSKFGVIYAGAQKNIGPAGLVLVIVRKDLLGKASAQTPTFIAWKAQADADSMLNTPPTYTIYLAGLVFEWIMQQGGLDAMATVNQRKATKLYDYIDASGFYANPVSKHTRSWMNVPFTVADPSLEKVFCAEAKEAGLVNLEGHRSVGGMRASIYNAVGEDAVDALIAFMKDFAAKNG